MTRQATGATGAADGRMSDTQRWVITVIAWGASMWVAYKFGYHEGVQATVNCVASFGTVCP